MFKSISNKALGYTTEKLETLSSAFNDRDWDRTSYALDKVNRKIAKIQNIEDEEYTAYHEAGHTLLQYLIQEGHTATKVTIIPTSERMGYAASVIDGIAHNSRKEHIQEMAVNFGGQVAEEIVFGDSTDGCLQDIKDTKEIASNMVQKWNMGGINVPHVNFEVKTDEFIIFGLPIWKRTTQSEKPFSEQMTKDIEKAQQGLMDRAKKLAHDIIIQNETALHALAEAIIDKRTLLEEEIKAIIENNKDKPSNTLLRLTPDMKI